MLKLIVLSACLFLLPSSFAAVLAIDYGTEWTKASLMKPGLPFDVLLNRDSKRKIHSSVGWNREDRLFGSDALNIVSRTRPYSLTTLPLSTYCNLGHQVSPGLIPIPEASSRYSPL